MDWWLSEESVEIVGESEGIENVAGRGVERRVETDERTVVFFIYLLVIEIRKKVRDNESSQAAERLLLFVIWDDVVCDRLGQAGERVVWLGIRLEGVR